MSLPTTMPEVSVVVPVYNSEKTVEAAIQSLLSLNYPGSVEFLFIDNRCTDRTNQILNEYASRITVLHENKPGQSAARNRGIRAARHSIVAFTDADCVVDANWLTDLIAPLADARVGISGGTICAIKPCNAIQLFGELLHDHEKPIQMFKPPYAISMNWASRKNVLLEVGGFDETMFRGEDCDLSYRIIQAGYRIVYQPGAIVAHRNKADLKALFREGFVDGFHAVKVLKKHRIYLRQFGHRSTNLNGYTTLAKTLLRCTSKNADANTVCDATFNFGKKTGKILGSLRFGCLEL
jgi:GT2 family glycosyltransferase